MQRSIRRYFGRLLLGLAVLLWAAAFAYGQTQPTGITYPRGVGPAMSATATTPTQEPMVYNGGLILLNSADGFCLVQVKSRDWPSADPAASLPLG